MPGKEVDSNEPPPGPSRKSPSRKATSATSHCTTSTAYSSPRSTVSSRKGDLSKREDCEAYIHKLATYYEGTRRTSLGEVKRQRNLALIQTREKVQQDLANSRGQRSRCIRLVSELKQIDGLEAKMKLMKKENSSLLGKDTSQITTRNTDTPQSDLLMTLNQVSPRSAHKHQRPQGKRTASPEATINESTGVNEKSRPSTSRHGRGQSQRKIERIDHEQIHSIAE